MRTLLFLHLLGAAIWVGGHLVLALGILPGALRRRDPQAIRAFEQVYERIGIPALLLQVVSGLWLASLWLPFDHWFGATPVARALQLKLLLLAATAALGVHARLRLIPNLNAESLPKLAGTSPRSPWWACVSSRSDRVSVSAAPSEHAHMKKGAGGALFHTVVVNESMAFSVGLPQPLGDFVLELHPLLLQPLQRQVVEGFATALDLVDALVEALIVRRQASEVGVVAMKLLQFGMKIRKLPGKRMLLERHDGPPLTLYTTPPD